MQWTELTVKVNHKDTERASDIVGFAAEGGIYVEDYSSLESDVYEVIPWGMIDDELLNKDRETVLIHIYIKPESNPVEVKAFIEKYPANYYAIRDKSKSGGIFKLAVKREDVINEITGYELFSVNVSSFNYMDNQLLVGEICISGYDVNAILSTNSKYSVRDTLRNPDFNFITSIFDDETLNNVPYFDNVYKYIVEHKLQNVIVEFAYFNKPVGINNENIIIYELRTDY